MTNYDNWKTSPPEFAGGECGYCEKPLEDDGECHNEDCPECNDHFLCASCGEDTGSATERYCCQMCADEEASLPGCIQCGSAVPVGPPQRFCSQYCSDEWEQGYADDLEGRKEDDRDA